MTLSAAEQYLLELINRARLDPAGEAARMGIDLNKDLAAGQITTTAKQVLASNALLETAATKHTLWMLETDTFSHTGINGSNPGTRIAAEGYSYSTWGENVAFVASTGTMTVEGSIETLNRNLFLSAGHRVNMLSNAFREVGLGAEAGQYTTGGRTYNSVFLTEDFATSGTAHFLTGVAYDDTNGNHFYSMGEGRSGIAVSAEGQSATTAAAGGYALALGSGTKVDVTGQVGALSFSLKVNMAPGNVKLDIVSGSTFYTSGTIWLGQGVNNVLQLGVGNLTAFGNGAANELTGNAGANRLLGLGGQDVLSGNAGNDVLNGGGGDDRLTGGTGNDLLRGALGADVFVFTAGDGIDRIADFMGSDGDRLRLDDALWGGQALSGADVVSQFGHMVNGHAVLRFAGGEVIHLLNLTSLTGLDGTIDIF